KAKPAAEIAGRLQSIQAELEAIDRDGLGIAPERYCLIANALEALPAKVEVSGLFHVDLIKPAPAATLGTDVIKEIQRGIKIAHILSRRGEDDLTQFCAAFQKRYEEREVPLVEALDEEIGVGFGTSKESSPLLRDLDFPGEPDERRISRERQ